MKFVKTIACSALFFILLLFSCNKNLDIPAAEKKLVVDGWIEQGEAPCVILTEVSPFFAQYNSLDLRSLMVTSAKVTVSNGDTSETLSLVRDDKMFPPYVYKGYGFQGEIGKTYHLKIYWKDEIYEATTSLLPAVKLKSLTPEPFYRGNDTLAIIRANFNDPPGQANYYRTFAKIQKKQDRFLPSFFSVVGDNLFDGQNFTFSIFVGFESLNNPENEIYFEKNDEVVVKFCSIDKSSFLFWQTAEREMALSGNPLTLSDRKIESNISNGALGHWTAYSFTLDTVMIDF